MSERYKLLREVDYTGYTGENLIGALQREQEVLTACDGRLRDLRMEYLKSPITS